MRQGDSLRLSGRCMSPPTSASPQSEQNLVTGVTPRGSFSCDARCFCPVGDTVWVSERSGIVTVRSGRSGDPIHILESKSGKFFGTAMLQVEDEVWIGTNDGRLLVFSAATFALVVELTNPDCQSMAEIHAIAFDGIHVFAAMAACRAGQWVACSKLFVRSFLRAHPVHALIVHNSVLYLGDGEGVLSVWDVKSGEVIASIKDSKAEITCMLSEPSSNTLWVSRADGCLDVYCYQPSVVRVQSLRETGRGKLTTLACVGGKVWAAGYDRTIYVFHAATRKFLGCYRGDHNSFIFAVGKVFVLETARIWSLSNGGKVHMFDGEGFFAPLRGGNEVADEVSACHNKIQQLRMQVAHSEVLISTEKDKVAQRDIEIAALRDEKQDQLLRIHALEHALDIKDGAMGDQNTQKTKLLDDVQKLTKKNGEQTIQINLLEKEKMTLRGDVARLHEELNRVRTQFSEKASQFVSMEQEKSALANEKQRLVTQLQQREKDIAAAIEETRKVKDAIAAKNADMTRKDNDMMTTAEKVALYKAERDSAVEQAKRSDEAKKRLEDTILLKEVELKVIMSQLASANSKFLTLEREFHELQRQREEEVRSRQRLHDSHVLRNHEYDALRQEKEGLQHQLDFEKQQTHSARDSETKMRLQVEELRRQLETEQNSVKMLQDQYTIFQFVINSRGELVNQLWTLYNKGVSSIKTLQELEVNIKATDPLAMDRMTLKREWKSAVVDRVRNSCAAVADFQRLSEYVIANYLSEYEKLHLGISTSKFQPDTQRPVVVGDQLLTKLRDVTLIKQYQTPVSSKVPKALPPPYDASFGSHHSIYQNPADTSAVLGAASPPSTYFGTTNVSNISVQH